MRKKVSHPYLAALLFSALTAIILTGTGFAEGISGHTLVVDAGHGGLDGGAVAADGTTESSLNLQIALRLQQLALFCGIPVKMTRSADALDYPDTETTIREKKVWDQKQRAELVNKIGRAHV